MDKKISDISELLKSGGEFSVGKKMDDKIKHELNALNYIKPISLTNLFMTNLTKIVAALGAVAIVAGVAISGVFQTQTTYASHLANAEKAMQELQLLQNQGVDSNQERVKELVQEVLNETSAALTLAEKESEGEMLQTALGEVKAVQEKAMNMFQYYEGEDNDAVKNAVMEMQQKQARVMNMLGDQTGETVRTQEQVQAQEQVHLKNAEQALEQLKLMNQNGESDGEKIGQLAEEAVDETNEALKLTEQKAAGEEKQNALMEVQKVQEQTMEMLKLYSGEENGSVESALRETEMQRTRVMNMLGDQTGGTVRTQEQVQPEEPLQVQAGR